MEFSTPFSKLAPLIELLELREEVLRQEQKKSERLSLIIYVAALAITYSFSFLRQWFAIVLIVGGIALLVSRSGDKRSMQKSVRYAYSSKSRLAALVLCIFFGVFGIHYFYVGRPGMGCVYLFTLGFFGIGWLIDIIRIVCGVFTDKYGLYL